MRRPGSQDPHRCERKLYLSCCCCLISSWLYVMLFFSGDWLKVVDHTSSFSVELGSVEDNQSLFLFFLCCLPLSLFIFCTWFEDSLVQSRLSILHQTYTADVWSIRQFCYGLTGLVQLMNLCFTAVYCFGLVEFLIIIKESNSSIDCFLVVIV